MAKSFGQRSAKKQEERAAESIGGQATNASGATGASTQKGDARKQFEMRVECKTTTLRSFSLTRADWWKISAQAAMQGEMPVMQIQFQGEIKNTRVAVIDWNWFEQLRNDSNALKEAVSEAKTLGRSYQCSCVCHLPGSCSGALPCTCCPDAGRKR